MITVSATINATLDKVWVYWTQPQHIVNWNFAGEDWHAPSAENDLRVGGKFKYRMASKDETMGFDFEGEYSLVTSQKAIHYFLADDRKIQITFEDLGDKVNIVESFDPENENPEAMQQQGWQMILDNFKAYVER
jgi:uncharacterized protein YndB with AHSA1/START domain